MLQLQHYLKYIPTKQLMQQQSSSHSDHSNIFALSSESSRLTHTQKRKKQHYSAFISKVRHLLQADTDDLDQLYRKVEIIVRKYFNEHKIVEFNDMYEHIASLRSNSGKMMAVVGLLQRRLAQQHRHSQHELNQKRTTNREDETQTNSKEVELLINQTKQAKPHQKLKQFKQSINDVTSSIEHPKRPTNSFHKSEAITTNMSDDANHWDRNRKPREQSPSRYSPDRLNSSFQQYQVRNRQYEQKVKELLSELNEIKQDIGSKKGRQQPPQEVSSSARGELKLKLEQNNENELRSESSLIDALDKNIMKDTNTNELNDHSRDVKEKLESMKEKLESIKEKSNESIASHQTVGSNKLIKPQQKQTSAKQVAMENRKQQYEGMSVEQKKQLVLQQANHITNQLKQLKMVASQLHSHPFAEINYENTDQYEKQKSQGSSLSAVSNSIFASLQTNNNQILQKISPTISKPMIESNLPSFKYMHNHSQQSIKQHDNNNLQPNGSNVIDSSAFSFSDNSSHVPLIDMRAITRSNYVGLNNKHYARTASRQNVRSNGSGPISNNGLALGSQVIPQHVETIRYIYNPYGNNVQPQRVNSPSIHFSHQQSNRSMNQSFQQTIPLMHNSSSTSIMRNTLNQQLQNHRQQRDQLERSSRVDFDSSRYSHLKQGQQGQGMRSGMNIEESQVNSVGNYSMAVGGGLRKKGINMLSPNHRPVRHR